MDQTRNSTGKAFQKWKDSGKHCNCSCSANRTYVNPKRCTVSATSTNYHKRNHMTSGKEIASLEGRNKDFPMAKANDKSGIPAGQAQTYNPDGHKKSSQDRTGR